ncbi:MAG: hypothetical protein IID33_00885, partial [Planctomycetes bacterium]|nr:hypothetical protein [Planctomycetota bacterium]
MVAFTNSQAVEAWPRIYVNQPGPDRIRSARNPIGALAIATDFIGSGKRIRTMLDKFWNVPSVRAWVSRRWVEFIVVAAAGTSEGMESVRAHRLKPRVLVEQVAPTLLNAGDVETRTHWRTLVRTYGPRTASGAQRDGFDGSAALIAFNYRIPNNTPLLFHESGGGWHALYTGPAPEDLRIAFGLETPEQRVERAVATIGVELATGLSVPDAQTVLVLSAVRGRWRQGAETAIVPKVDSAGFIYFNSDQPLTLTDEFFRNGDGLLSSRRSVDLTMSLDASALLIGETPGDFSGVLSFASEQDADAAWKLYQEHAEDDNIWGKVMSPDLAIAAGVVGVREALGVRGHAASPCGL